MPPAICATGPRSITPVEIESHSGAKPQAARDRAGPERAIGRFYFPAEYDGLTFADERGELFPTAAQARAYAPVIAHELARHNDKTIIVFLVDETGAALAEVRPSGLPE
jgi:hypothetical protein